MNDASIAIIIGLLLVNLFGLLVIGIRMTLMGSENRKLDNRLTHLEAKVLNLPTHRDLTGLSGDISEISESVSALSGKTETVTQMLRTIQEHLLENDR